MAKEEFATKSAMCKPCHRKYTREHYQANKQSYLAKARRNDEKYLVKVRTYLVNYYDQNPCIDCGESDIVLLDFDHRDPETKSFNIADGIKRKLSLEVLQTEIAKCDIRCVKCHRYRTARQFNWWQLNADVYPRATNA